MTTDRHEPQPWPSIEVWKISERELCEHLGVEDEKRFIGIQHWQKSKVLWILLEKADADNRDVPATGDEKR